MEIRKGLKLVDRKGNKYTVIGPAHAHNRYQLLTWRVRRDSDGKTKELDPDFIIANSKPDNP